MRCGIIIAAYAWAERTWGFIIIRPTPQPILWWACLCACSSVRDHIFGTTRTIFTKLFVHITYASGSVLLWRRSDMSRISGFVDDVICAHKLRLLDVAARLRQWGSHAAFGLSHRNTRSRQRTLGTNSCCQNLLVRSERVKYSWHHICT